MLFKLYDDFMGQTHRRLKNVKKGSFRCRLSYYKSGVDGKDVHMFGSLPDRSSFISAIKDNYMKAPRAIRPWHELLEPGDSYVRLALDVDGWWHEDKKDAEISDSINDVIQVVDACVKQNCPEANLTKTLATNNRRCNYKSKDVPIDGVLQRVTGFVMSCRVVYKHVLFKSMAECGAFMNKVVIPAALDADLVYPIYRSKNGRIQTKSSCYVDGSIYGRNRFLRLPLTRKYLDAQPMVFVDNALQVINVNASNICQLLDDILVGHAPKSSKCTLITEFESHTSVRKRSRITTGRRSRIRTGKREALQHLLPPGVTVKDVYDSADHVKTVTINEHVACGHCNRKHSSINKIYYQVNTLTGEVRQLCHVSPSESTTVRDASYSHKKVFENRVRENMDVKTLNHTGLGTMTITLFDDSEEDVVLDNQSTLIWHRRKRSPGWTFLCTLDADLFKDVSMFMPIPEDKCNTFAKPQPSSSAEVHRFSYLDGVKMYGYCAHVGAGKTGAMCVELAKLYSTGMPRCLVFSTRVTHGTSIMSKLLSIGEQFNLKVGHYKDNNFDARECNLVVCSYESAHRRFVTDTYQVFFDYIFIDECECLLDNFMAGLVAPLKNKSYMESAARLAKRVYLMDAFMSQRSYVIYKELFGVRDEDIAIERNTENGHIQRKWFIHKSRESILRRIYVSLTDNRNVFIAVGCKEDGIKILEDMARMGLGDLQGEFYYQESANRAHFAEDVNELWINLRWVMSTNTLEVGVDFNPKADLKPILHFSDVFVLLTNRELTTRTYAQMAYRVRHAETVHCFVAIAASSTDKPLTLNSVYQQLQLYSDAVTFQEKEWVRNCDKKMILDQKTMIATYDLLVKDWYYHLVCWSILERNVDQATRLQRVIAFAMYMGGSVSFIDDGHQKSDAEEKKLRRGDKLQRIALIEDEAKDATVQQLYEAWCNTMTGDVTPTTKEYRTLLRMRLEFPNVPNSLKICKKIERYYSGLRRLCTLILHGPQGAIAYIRERADIGSEVITLAKSPTIKDLNTFSGIIAICINYFGGLDAKGVTLDWDDQTAVCKDLRVYEEAQCCASKPVPDKKTLIRRVSSHLQRAVCKKIVRDKDGLYTCEFMEFTDKKLCVSADVLVRDSKPMYKLKPRNANKIYRLSDYYIERTQQRPVAPTELSVKRQMENVIYTSSNIMALEKIPCEESQIVPAKKRQKVIRALHSPKISADIQKALDGHIQVPFDPTFK